MKDYKYKTITKTCVVCKKEFTCKYVCLKTKLYCTDKCAYVIRSAKIKEYKIANRDRLRKQNRLKYWVDKDKAKRYPQNNLQYF